MISSFSSSLFTTICAERRLYTNIQRSSSLNSGALTLSRCEKINVNFQKIQMLRKINHNENQIFVRNHQDIRGMNDVTNFTLFDYFNTQLTFSTICSGVFCRWSWKVALTVAMCSGKSNLANTQGYIGC